MRTDMKDSTTSINKRKIVAYEASGWTNLG